MSAEFGVTEAEAHSTLSELCDSRLIERFQPSKFIVADWPDDGDSDEEEYY